MIPHVERILHELGPGLVDATRVVFDTQHQAGIDLPTDGELYRFDSNHPHTNGMIEYFVQPMSNGGRLNPTGGGALPPPSRSLRLNEAHRISLHGLAR